MGIAGLVLFPLFFGCFNFFPRRYFVTIVLGTQIIGVFFLSNINAINHPFYLGMLRALFTTAYFQMLHINLAAHASDEYRGFEMSIAQALSKVGGIIGALLAGSLVVFHLSINPVMAAFILQFLVTVGLALTSPHIKKGPIARGPEAIFIWKISVIH